VRAALCGLALLAVGASWTPETVDLFEGVPIQDGGRVKPLATYARFTLMRFSGATKVRTADATLSPTEWLLDSLFKPDRAQGYKVFTVNSPEVMEALGLPYERKRDRYSYRDLLPGRAVLDELGARHAQTDPQLRSSSEIQILRLAQNVRDFEELIHAFDFARAEYSTEGVTAFGERSRSSLLEVLEHAPNVMTMGAMFEAEREPLYRLLTELDQISAAADSLALIPPQGAEQTSWLTPAEALPLAFLKDGASLPPVQLMKMLGSLAQSVDDPVGFQTHAREYAAAAGQLARARNEGTRIGLEVFYYDLNIAGIPLFYAGVRWLFILAFLLVALSWTSSRSRILSATVTALLVLATSLLVYGIVLRCLIRMRPPVTTLYETILFITAVAVVVALAAEWFTRRRVALSLAPLLGALGLFLADKHEAIEAVDTMPTLMAVLDTNFWLSTHVTTIAIGYAAGLLAAGIANVFVLAKLLGLRRNDPEFYESITRTVYGVVCFGLLFSTVGTVLGGIWANESWGRFWGWDPKENGALLIVLWGLLIVHARLGGFIGAYGINLAAVVGGMVVAFSWWGVNLLGVGLHSYGFTNSAFTGLVVFYGIQTMVLLAGFAAWLWEELLPAPSSNLSKTN
jgi:ABC-type transport system involved in cytochrome c biogenesis permease subunit